MSWRECVVRDEGGYYFEWTDRSKPSKQADLKMYINTDDFWHFNPPLGIKWATQCQLGKETQILLLALTL